MCVFTRGQKVVKKGTNPPRIVGKVERMDDTKPGEAARVIVAGVSHLASTLAPLEGPWDQGEL